jgi:hypothetical protein
MIPKLILDVWATDDPTVGRNVASVGEAIALARQLTEDGFNVRISDNTGYTWAHPITDSVEEFKLLAHALPDIELPV